MHERNVKYKDCIIIYRVIADIIDPWDLDLFKNAPGIIWKITCSNISLPEFFLFVFIRTVKLMVNKASAL